MTTQTTPPDADFLASKPRISPGYRMQWEEVQQCYVLLYPEGMVQLNEAAADILKYCTGERSVSEVIAKLEAEFNETDLSADISDFLTDALDRGWLRVRS